MKKNLYSELFINKIKNNTKNLIIDYYHDYKDIIYNKNIINEKNVTIDIFNFTKEDSEKINKIVNTEYNINYFSKSINEFNPIEKYNNIIIFDLFNNKNDIESTIEIVKKFVKKYGKIIFINDIITKYSQYMYHPFSYFRDYFTTKCMYIDDIYDIIRFNNLYIIDCFRLLTFDLFTYPIEYFSIICEIKN
jgi:hypothetical protein